MRSRNLSQISIEAEGGLSFISGVHASQPHLRLFILELPGQATEWQWSALAEA